MRFISIITILFMVLACECTRSNQLTDDEKKLSVVYCQLVNLEKQVHLNQQAQLDSSRAILNHFDLTQTRYDSLVSEMNANPQKWQKFYQLVKKQLAAVDSTQND